MRVYNDSIRVSVAAEQAGPRAFVWRGRRFEVLEVFSHWAERTPWWRTALLPLEPGQTHTGVAENLQDGMQDEVWRVEAVPGRAGGAGRAETAGVYDLARSGERWCLRRVLD